MTLQLLIPQYQEDNSVVKNMLDSIKVQQGVNLDDIEVLIGNDGSDIKLSEDFLASYPFSIKYLQFEHTGQAGARKRLFDASTAEYIMFCDADDMFLNNLALYMIFSAIQKGFDALVCNFIEELKNKDFGNYYYVPHSRDYRFVHGKVYRRRHLIDNAIFWDENIKCHEDSMFNILAISTAKNREFCKTPIYLWKWRDSSICRNDKLYVLKTYPSMIQSNTALITEFIRRNMLNDAKSHVGIFIYNTYYMLNKPIWLDPMNAKYRYDAEKCFQTYFKTHKDMFLMLDSATRKSIISGVKKRVLNEGVMLEQFTFDAWLKHIEELE